MFVAERQGLRTGPGARCPPSHLAPTAKGKARILGKRRKFDPVQGSFRLVDSVIFLVGLENFRSQKAVERIGVVRVGSRPDAAGRASFLYEITASAFAQHSASAWRFYGRHPLGLVVLTTRPFACGYRPSTVGSEKGKFCNSQKPTLGKLFPS